jgi:hypothetical protein
MRRGLVCVGEVVQNARGQTVLEVVVGVVDLGELIMRRQFAWFDL